MSSTDKWSEHLADLGDVGVFEECEPDTEPAGLTVGDLRVKLEGIDYRTPLRFTVDHKDVEWDGGIWSGQTLDESESTPLKVVYTRSIVLNLTGKGSADSSGSSASNRAANIRFDFASDEDASGEGEG